MTTPTTYAPAKQFVGIANESAQGTAVAMTATLLVDSFKPKDSPKFLEDKAWRGAMATDSFAQIPGTQTAELDLSGPVFLDGLGYILRNIMGDLAVTGTSTGSGGTTLSASAAAGDTSISTAVSIPSGTLVQIGSGATAEVVTTGTPSGSGPYTIPLTAPVDGLAYGHASSETVQPVTGPYTYAWSLLNSGNGQPLSHTLTHFLGPTASTGARQYPGACFSEVGFKWNAESDLFTWDAKATSYPSVIAGAAPVSNPGTTAPMASWRMSVGIGGPASGGTLIRTVTDGEINLKRELNPYFTGNGAQSPYIIQRAGLTCEGKLNFVADSESPYLYMINNTQPQLQLKIDNGLAGLAYGAVQFDFAQAAFTESEPDGSKTAVEYSDNFKAVLNTANAGGSGSYSPCKISVTCNVAPGTY
ncbi:phage tail tube protein [Streptomyces sp. NBC_00670]|uniref:phage tail tube protein n=1 Tax=Streptomyces sp. NBC_00670 TaxID=2975804 RepID=UPI002E35088B|nr:phage tail tube protein [Streptomyces sp. NBC_00670]